MALDVRIWLAAALTCVLLSACGDDDAEPQEFARGDVIFAEDPATRQFRRRFEEVCVAAGRALRRAERQEFGQPRPDNPPPTRAELQRFYEEVVVPARRGELETLRRIETPPDLQAPIAAFLAEHEAATAALAAELALIREPGIEETARSDADAAADAAGVPRCGLD